MFYVLFAARICACYDLYFFASSIVLVPEELKRVLVNHL